jgi:hypothetical protein
VDPGCGVVSTAGVGEGLIVIPYPALPLQPFTSVAVTVKLNGPLAVGVPLTVPVLESARPGGKAPAVTANVVVEMPPTCVMVVAGYATPTVPIGNVVPDSVIAPHPAMPIVVETVWPSIVVLRLGLPKLNPAVKASLALPLTVVAVGVAKVPSVPENAALVPSGIVPPDDVSAFDESNVKSAVTLEDVSGGIVAGDALILRIS